MAKRYIKYEELVGIGEHKPAGTLGKHYCTVVQQGERTVVIGSREGRVTLNPGDTLGYDCGRIWLVPKPESYKDPIRRILALAKVSQKVLEFSDEPVIFTISGGERLKDSCADTATGEEILGVLGEHKEEYVEGTRMDMSASPGWSGAYSYDKKIVGGEAIVIEKVVSFEPTTHHRRRGVGRVVVRSFADKQKVASWLEEFLTPEGRKRKELREEKEAADKKAKDEADLKEAKRLWGVIVPASLKFWNDWRGFSYKGESYVVSHNPNRQGDPEWATLYRTYIDRGRDIRLLTAYRWGLLQAWADEAQRLSKQ